MFYCIRFNFGNTKWNCMKNYIILLIFCLIIFTACKHQNPLIPSGPSSPPIGGWACSPDSVYFQNDILPIFQSYCAKSGCHDVSSHREGIILTDYFNIMTTGQIVGGNPNHGNIYESLTTGSSSNIMPPPPDLPLSADQIAMILKWINQGAQNTYCTEVCDTLDVKYSTKISTLLTNKCVGCHNGSVSSSATDYSNYAALQGIALDGNLMGCIKQLAGYPKMPKGGNMLSDCEIRMVQIWVDAGAPNN